MTEQPLSIDVTQEDFQNRVIEESTRRPVLVDFWASWCGPCQTLMPLLERIVESYQGKLILAKVNIDEQQELATRFGVRSVPTVGLFRYGEQVDQFLGVQPETTIRSLVEQYIERESDRLVERAVDAAADGDTEGARTLLEQAQASDPDNVRIDIELARLDMAVARYDDAAARLNALHPDLRAKPEVAGMLARLEFAQAVVDAPAPDALEARCAQRQNDACFQLAAHRVLQGRYEEALELLLALLQRDRKNDAAREGMLQVFELLGGEGELVTRYRSRLFNVLH